MGAVFLIGIVAALLFTRRGVIGAQFAESYLRRRGIASHFTVEKLGPTGFTGKARLGPANDPDLTVDRIQVTFAPWSGFGVPKVQSIHLIRPRLKVRFDGKRIGFGSLQPLVDEALKRPGTGPGPDIIVEQGGVRVLTPAGNVELHGDAALPQGRLERLRAVLLPAALARGDDRAVATGGTLVLNVNAETLNGQVALNLSNAGWKGVRLQDLMIQSGFALPYAKGRQPGLDGPVAFDVRAQTARVDAGPGGAANLHTRLWFQGATRGPLERLDLRGDAHVTLSASQARGRERLLAAAPLLSGDLHGLHLWRGDKGLAGRTAAALDLSASALEADARRIQGLHVQARSTQLDFALADQWRGGGAVEAAVGAAAYSQPVLGGDLRLADMAMTFRGRAAVGPKGVVAALRGGVTGRGGLSGDSPMRLAEGVPLLGTDPPNRMALAAAMRSARLEAPDAAADMASGKIRLTLHRALRLASASGAHLTLAPVAGAPLAVLGAGESSGGFSLAIAGGGVPTVQADVGQYRFSGRRLAGAGSFRVVGDLGTWRQLSLQAAGRLSGAPRSFAFTPSDCANLSLGTLVSDGKPSVERLKARLCPEPGVPALSVSPAGWWLRARAERAGGHVPVLLTDIGEASGVVEARGAPGGEVSADVRIARAQLLDAGPQARFRPLYGSGRATLSRNEWRGDFSVAEGRRGAARATIALRHLVTTGQGEAQIQAPRLAFSPKGLQPADISPLMAGFGSEVNGQAAFQGRIGWTKGGLASSGRFATAGLDFRSAFGRVKQARVNAILTSLTPFLTAPEQHVSAEHVDWLIPLDNLEATYAVTASAVKVASARALMAKGSVSLDASAFPFKPNQPLSGVVHLRDVDLGTLLTRLGLADALSVQARISGDLPFTSAPTALRVNGGKVFATGPGRLSINRKALTSAAAAGALAPPNAVQDFAYQALESLAFDQLEAQIDSRSGGRLGVIFHIKGRHDPPVAAPTRIGILDALRGRAFDKPIPLPKGTPIDLTLDTSLNFDELMTEYRALNARSGAVQPSKPR